MVDNLPCATKFNLLGNNEEQYESGYKLGYFKDGEYFLNNHLKIILKYHSEKSTYVEILPNRIHLCCCCRKTNQAKITLFAYAFYSI